MKSVRYRVAALAMAGAAALLLLASGGYYVYAGIAKTASEDLVHAEQRPVFAIETTLAAPGGAPVSVAAPAPQTVSAGASEAGGVRAAAALSRAARMAPNVFAAAPAIRWRESIELAEVYSSGLRGGQAHPALLKIIEGSSGAPIVAAQASSDDGQSEDAPQPLTLDAPAGGRIEAAIDWLHVRQARRGMDRTGYEAVFEEDEPTGLAAEAARQREEVSASIAAAPIATPAPTGRRGRTLTSEELVATRNELVDVRATDAAPSASYATMITVSGITLQSRVEELAVIETGDSRAWETPKHVVGHIPTTSAPGKGRQGWYFGHLESPLRGEGNVFHRLPELAARFKKGERFTISLDAGESRYVYQVYRTDVVAANEFAVTDSGLNDITLVSCWPQYVYSERVLVTAALVDIVELPAPELGAASAGGS